MSRIKLTEEQRKGRHKLRNKSKDKEWRIENKEILLVKRRRYIAEHRVTINNQKRASRDRHIDEYKERYKVKFLRPEVRLRRIIMNALARARREGRDNDPRIVDALMAEGVPEFCISCGAKIAYEAGDNPRHTRWPSIDRIDNSKGYVLGNVAIICMRCNHMKRDATIAELEMLIAYMKKYLR